MNFSSCTRNVSSFLYFFSHTNIISFTSSIRYLSPPSRLYAHTAQMQANANQIQISYTVSAALHRLVDVKVIKRIAHNLLLTPGFVHISWRSLLKWSVRFEMDSGFKAPAIRSLHDADTSYTCVVCIHSQHTQHTRSKTY